MTNKEATTILILEQSRWNRNPNLIIDEQLYDAFDVAIKELSSSENQNKWIPVSEGLPEECKNVIVTDIETSDTYQSQYFGNGYWECDNGYFRNRIVAWMPLPEPYKPQESEERR